MKRYGKYEVIEKIGVGGFGEVFKGFDPVIKRNLAIKTCNSDDETIRSRFYREAEIAGNLHHRNITTVYDFGVEDDVPYLVQELLTGEDLDKIILRGAPETLGEKVLYLQQIARGLEMAHSRGVIHRDIKPSNVHILKDGTAKILDFGIAKLIHQESGLTKTGMTVGTAAYLAPEQVKAGDIDHRTDIFSFGILAYELISGERPFQADTFSAVLYQILSEAPKPLLEVAPDCLPELARLVERCIEKEAEDRQADCGEIIQELKSIRKRLDARAAGGGAAPDTPDADLPLPQESRPPAAASRPSIPVWAWLLGPLALAAVATAIYFFMGRDLTTSSTGVDPASPPAGEEETLALEGEVEDPPGASDAAGFIGAENAVAAESPTPEIPEPEPAVIEPPPPPVQAKLTVRKSWTDLMTVSLDGRPPLPLSRDWEWDLDPGRHKLTFRLDLPDYPAFAEETVVLAEAEERTLEAPIDEPGKLTVQPALGTPQALIKIGDDRVTQSPATVQLEPGLHALSIEALNGSYDPIAVEVDLASGGWSIVTFDLTGETETTVGAREPDE